MEGELFRDLHCQTIFAELSKSLKSASRQWLIWNRNVCPALICGF